MEHPPFPLTDDEQWQQYPLVVPRGIPITLEMTYVPIPPPHDVDFWLPATAPVLEIGAATEIVVATEMFPCRVVGRQQEPDGTRYFVVLDEE